jgi:hypothetical protein
MERKGKFIARVNAFVPVIFAAIACILLVAGAKKPNLFKYDAFNATIGGLTTSAIALANTGRDND